MAEYAKQESSKEIPDDCDEEITVVYEKIRAAMDMVDFVPDDRIQEFGKMAMAPAKTKKKSATSQAPAKTKKKSATSQSFACSDKSFKENVAAPEAPAKTKKKIETCVSTSQIFTSCDKSFKQSVQAPKAPAKTKKLSATCVSTSQNSACSNQSFEECVAGLKIFECSESEKLFQEYAAAIEACAKTKKKTATGVSTSQPPVLKIIFPVRPEANENHGENLKTGLYGARPKDKKPKPIIQRIQRVAHDEQEIAQVVAQRRRPIAHDEQEIVQVIDKEKQQAAGKTSSGKINRPKDKKPKPIIKRIQSVADHEQERVEVVAQRRRPIAHDELEIVQVIDKEKQPAAGKTSSGKINRPKDKKPKPIIKRIQSVADDEQERVEVVAQSCPIVHDEHKKVQVMDKKKQPAAGRTSSGKMNREDFKALVAKRLDEDCMEKAWIENDPEFPWFPGKGSTDVVFPIDFPESMTSEPLVVLGVRLDALEKLSGFIE